MNNFRVARWFVGDQQVTEEEFRQNMIGILMTSERFKELIRNMPLNKEDKPCLE